MRKLVQFAVFFLLVWACVFVSPSALLIWQHGPKWHHGSNHGAAVCVYFTGYGLELRSRSATKRESFFGLVCSPVIDLPNKPDYTERLRWS